MPNVHLTIASMDYDHVRDFREGRVTASGIDATWLNLGLHEMFARFLANREWDVSERSFAKFIAEATRPDSDIIGLPVFPRREFLLRHHLREPGEGHPPSRGPARQAHRPAGMGADRNGL